MNGFIIGIHQLVQKLELITPIISNLQEKHNDRSLYWVSLTGSKPRMNNINHLINTFQGKQNK